MTIRELPFEEWDKLEGLPIAENGLPSPDVMIMVAENEDGVIVGHWTAGTILMLEGLWVNEAYRKPSSVLWRLFTGMIDKLEEDGIPDVHTIVQTDEMLELAQHGGFKVIPGHFLIKRLEE